MLAGAEIDATTAHGRLVFGIFTVLAEFERELIAERTRARGRMGGRPRKMDVVPMLCLAKRLGITTSALYMYVNGNGSVKTPGQELLDAAQDA